jgi:hypothetical protein
MNIAAVLGGWCAVSVVIGLAFGRLVRTEEPGAAPRGPAAVRSTLATGLVTAGADRP